VGGDIFVDKNEMCPVGVVLGLWNFACSPQLPNG
jgi:hypothetical protein